MEEGRYGLAINLEADPRASQAAALLRPHSSVSVFGEAPGAGDPPRERGIDRLKHEIWNRPDLLADYPELNSQFIGEIYCRMARGNRLHDPRSTLGVAAIPHPRRPLSRTGGSRSAKLWPRDHWVALADWLHGNGVEAGLLGAPIGRDDRYHAARSDAAVITRGVIDLRGALTLPPGCRSTRAGAGCRHCRQRVNAYRQRRGRADDRPDWREPEADLDSPSTEPHCPRAG